MEPRILLRLEGGVVAVSAVAAYFLSGHPPWLFVVAVLAPDLSMLGYLGGPRVGAGVYNLAHTYVAPLVLGGLGVLTGRPVLLAVALGWLAHIGGDRLVGYGLKHATGFGDTHLTRLDDPEIAVDPPFDRPAD